MSAELYADHKFAICGHGLELKTSLNAKWRAQPFFKVCVAQFISKYNLKVSKADPTERREELVLAGLKRVEVDGDAVPLPTAQSLTSAVVPLKAEKVELFFGPPPPSEVRVAVSANGVEITVRLDAKWLAKPFVDAVVKPLVHMHNKRNGHAAVEPAQLVGMAVDDTVWSAKQMEHAKGAASAFDVLGYYTARVELFFSAAAADAYSRDRGAPRMPSTFRFKFAMGAADWNKVTHLDWQLMELNQADGPEMARELGSHKLLELKELYLYSNDLRDAGLRGLAPALTRQQMPKLCELHLGKNRIGDAGVEALVGASDLHLRLLSLHSNAIGDEGCRAIFLAIVGLGTFDVDKVDLHSNQRITAEGRALFKQVPSTLANFDPPQELDYGTPFIPRSHTPNRDIPGPMGDQD